MIERRTLQEVELFDVSSVTYPAYEDTDGGLAAATMARELRDRRLTPDPAGRPRTRTTTPTTATTAGDPGDDGDPGDAGAPPPPATATTPTTPTTDGGPGADGDAGAPPVDPAEVRTATEDDQPLHVLLLAHSAGDHTGTSRAKCPPCTKALTQVPPAPAGTPAAA